MIFLTRLASVTLKTFWHYVKSVRIGSYSGPHFSHIFPHSDWIRRDTQYLSVFRPNAEKCEKNADQNNSEYGQFLRSVNFHNIDIYLRKVLKIKYFLCQ